MERNASVYLTLVKTFSLLQEYWSGNYAQAKFPGTRSETNTRRSVFRGSRRVESPQIRSLNKLHLLFAELVDEGIPQNVTCQGLT